jgi:hypothetical protein
MSRRFTYCFHSLSQRDHIFGLLLQYTLNENNNNQSRGAAGDDIIICRKLVFKQSKAILANLPFPRLERSKQKYRNRRTSDVAGFRHHLLDGDELVPRRQVRQAQLTNGILKKGKIYFRKTQRLAV